MPCEFCLIHTELTRQTSESSRVGPSIDSVSANVARVRLTISCRFGNCGKYKLANTSTARFLGLGDLLLMAESHVQ
jgi:hypothetical protein